MRALKLVAVLSAMSFFCMGCSHSLQIKNLDSYRKSNLASPNERLRIGFVSASRDANTDRVVKEVASELLKYSDKVILADTNPSMSADSVDIWVRVGITPTYEGSGWNFLINWPGFLIWTPAWNGYVYKVKYNADVVLTDAKTNMQIDSFSIPFDFDVRHSDMDRTWTEVGWLEVGVIPLIGGFVFTGYDDDISPLVADSAKDVVADNLVQEMVSRINRNRMFALRK